ncbi:uncharacterized protein SETTUDRAFT_157214 [Exserohilum turcica Et28A]|uniref:Uncharacterized protein n=1 Tax=Exserohilum turcicum (strain 28A) TaxID=671987 RepID=R0JIT8_EXST2|nr:uncharacterized protein SETTUDRAFT_157214 [Exserohilum turcica Et28A]EOA81263.1 hypothetical protein SETTUDRAFT_157214 [Exserohilum turcica Et28A]
MSAQLFALRWLNPLCCKHPGCEQEHCRTRDPTSNQDGETMAKDPQSAKSIRVHIPLFRRQQNYRASRQEPTWGNSLPICDTTNRKHVVVSWLVRPQRFLGNSLLD